MRTAVFSAIALSSLIVACSSSTITNTNLVSDAGSLVGGSSSSGGSNAASTGGTGTNTVGGSSAGGQTASQGGVSASAGGSSSNDTGGATSTATGGVTSAATGGVTSTATGGVTSTATGGVTSTATGGVTSTATGGVTSTATGGVTSAATGGATTCSAGFGDCTSAPGCETPLNTTSNCGACGQACSAPTNGSATCLNSGSCSFTCDQNFTQCGSSCVNTSNDANNCSACGHSCLGGTCTASVCQPIALGTVATGGGNSLIISGGALYAITAATQTYSAVWKLDPNAPSTPVSVLSSIYRTPQCIMNGKMYWVSSDNGTNSPSDISYCSVSNCAATTQLFTTSPGHIFSSYAEQPICDLSTNELVWRDFTTGLSGKVETIYRAAANGTNIRAMTSFLVSSNYQLEIGFVSQRADRYFFLVEDLSSTPQVETLYYVPTNVQNVSPVSVVTGNAGQNGVNVGLTEFTNDSLFMWPDNSGYTPQQSFSLPLPNGILSGSPPIFYPGYISSGVMDDQNFYGVFTSLPSDAIGKCALSNCTSPGILFRGEANANGFTQDSTAIYWVTPGLTSQGFTVWKAAK